MNITVNERTSTSSDEDHFLGLIDDAVHFNFYIETLRPVYEVKNNFLIQLILTEEVLQPSRFINWKPTV